MSLSECERFTADLQSSEALRAEAGKVQAATSQETPLARMVAFAASKGYGITVQEAREHLTANVATTGKALSDADLDAVAGGNYAAFRAAQGLPYDPRDTLPQL